jgi:hypothetical protein
MSAMVFGSSAVTVHQAAYDLVVAGFGTRFKTYRKTPMLQIQPTDLPVLAVHIMRERRTAWGQRNQGEPKYQAELTLGFSGAVHVETDQQDELQALEQTMSELDEMLLCQPSFVNLTDGVESMDRLAQYAKVGEVTLFEIRVEMVLGLGQVLFEPNIPDDFLTIHVESRYPSPTTDPAQVQQIVAQYDIPQNAKRKPN